MNTMYQTGLVSVSFRGLSPEEVIALCKQNGLSRIEWGSDIHVPPTDPENAARVAKLQGEAGIVTSSYGTYFRLGVHKTEELAAYIKTAKLLGTDILRIWGGEKNFEDLTPEEWDHLVLCGCEAAKAAEAAGVTLCLECHNKTCTNCPEGTLALLEAVASPALKMYWQPNQYHSEEWNLGYAKAIAPHVVHIHVFHWIEKEKFPLAQGLAVWKKYLSCFDGSQNLLLEFMPDGKPETLPREVETLGRLIG